MSWIAVVPADFLVQYPSRDAERKIKVGGPLGAAYERSPAAVPDV